VPETHANFVWMPLGDETVAFAEAVQVEGVSVRPFPGDGARVTIGERAANDLFLEVARSWRQ
jgi:histidinol-phosphate aminotransferase